MVISKRERNTIHFPAVDFMNDSKEAVDEWFLGLQFRLKRRELLDSPPISQERAKELVEKFRNLTEVEASWEMFKLEKTGTGREILAAMIGATERTKKRKKSQATKRKNADWSMDEVLDDFLKFMETEKTKTAAAIKVAALHEHKENYYKTVLRHAEKRGLI